MNVNVTIASILGLANQHAPCPWVCSSGVSLGLFDNAKEASGARVARGWLMW